jgi:hypothetical protein
LPRFSHAFLLPATSFMISHVLPLSLFRI